MQFVLYYQFRRPIVASDTKKRTDTTIPRHHSEFVHRSKKQGRRITVQLLINYLYGQPCRKIAILLRTKHIKMLAAHRITPFSDKLFILIIFYEFCTAPRALKNLKLIVLVFLTPDIIILADSEKLIQMDLRVIVLIRNMRTAYP